MKQNERSKSIKDISAEMGLSANTIHVEMRHALKKLRRLEEAGMTREQIMELTRLR